jgi:hypothetical protein
MSTQKNIKIIREICEEQAITIEATRYSGSYPIFTLRQQGFRWEFKTACSPSAEPSKKQIRDYIRQSQTRARIKLGHAQARVTTEAPTWGKTPEQLAFEEQYGKAMRLTA